MAYNIVNKKNDCLNFVYYVIKFNGEDSVALVHKNLMADLKTVKWPTDQRLPNSAIINGDLKDSPFRLLGCSVLYSTSKLK